MGYDFTFHRGDVLPDQRVEGRDIIVTGDVRERATVIAQGGGATVIVMGDVYRGANVGARGGAAKVLILGEVRG